MLRSAGVAEHRRELWLPSAGATTTPAGGSRATVAGGSNNSAGVTGPLSPGAAERAGGDYAAVVGGNINMLRAPIALPLDTAPRPITQAASCWGDSSAADVPCNDDKPLVARATGAFTLITTAPSPAAPTRRRGSCLEQHHRRATAEPLPGRRPGHPRYRWPACGARVQPEKPGRLDPPRTGWWLRLCRLRLWRVGHGDQHADADGVAIAAIQAL